MFVWLALLYYLPPFDKLVELCLDYQIILLASFWELYEELGNQTRLKDDPSCVYFARWHRWRRSTSSRHYGMRRRRRHVPQPFFLATVKPNKNKRLTWREQSKSRNQVSSISANLETSHCCVSFHNSIILCCSLSFTTQHI